MNGKPFNVDVANCILHIFPTLNAGEKELVVTIPTSATNYSAGGRKRTVRTFPENTNPLSGPD